MLLMCCMEEHPGQAVLVCLASTAACFITPCQVPPCGIWLSMSVWGNGWCFAGVQAGQCQAMLCAQHLPECAGDTDNTINVVGIVMPEAWHSQGPAPLPWPVVQPNHLPGITWHAGLYQLL